MSGGTVTSASNAAIFTIALNGTVETLSNSGIVSVGYSEEIPGGTLTTLIMEAANSNYCIEYGGSIGTVVFKHDYNGTVADGQLVKLGGESAHVFLGDRVLAEKTEAVRFDSLPFAVLGSMLEDMPGTKFASVGAAVERYCSYVKLLGNVTQIDVEAGQGVRLDLNNHTVNTLNVAANGYARIKNGTIEVINSLSGVFLDGNVTVTTLNINGGDGAAYNSTVGTLNNRCDADESFEVHGGSIGIVNNYGSMGFQCNQESGEYQNYQVTTLNNFSGGTAKLLGGTFTTVNNAGACEIGGNHRQTVSITDFYHQTANAGLEVIGITYNGVYSPADYSIGTMHLLADLSLADIKDAQLLVNDTAEGAPLLVNNRALFQQTNPVRYDSLPYAVEDSETAGKYYANVEDAANNGAKGVKLLDNVEFAYVASGKTITVDLNGKTITTLNNSGKVTVTDNATGGTVTTLNNSGEAEVIGGKVDEANNEGTITVSENGTVTTLNNMDNGTANVNGGTVGTLNNGGTATVKGGEVTTLTNSGTVSVSGGEVGHISSTGENVNITGGFFGEDVSGLVDAGTAVVAKKDDMYAVNDSIWQLPGLDAENAVLTIVTAPPKGASLNNGNIPETLTIKNDSKNKLYINNKVVGKDADGKLSDFPTRSSGGYVAPTYSIDTAKTENGSIDVSHKSAIMGQTVTVSVTPDNGYELDTLIVLDKNGKEVKLTDKDGKYTFEMPASKVTVKASFGEVKENPNTGTFTFDDVNPGDYFYDAVLWAVENGITVGTSETTFSPNDSCTRGQIVTFLWRAAGSPEPKNAAGFSDVSADAYYARAVAWAVENGITMGTSETTFSPDETCTRAQAAVLIYRYIQSTGSGFTGAWMFRVPFTDIPDWAFEAIAWCYMHGITSGTSATTFSPDDDCTRGQIVTFLWRALAE